MVGIAQGSVKKKVARICYACNARNAGDLVVVVMVVAFVVTNYCDVLFKKPPINPNHLKNK